MTTPKPSRADDIATVRLAVPWHSFSVARGRIIERALDRLASEPCPDAIRDAALEEAAAAAERSIRAEAEFSFTPFMKGGIVEAKFIVQRIRALKFQPAKET